ncbi:hypothetical protein KY084_04225 [Stakelama sp. CBK3Z-3]|uniref:Uncharacterized protein n=1 Tax=Stakelama flava TaxID=2860338 RepID=A0ABS6XJJ6_9SPHN|nr:hypothetical protein [Stakelama flava]MBW4330079.1 hypothetical protein [Stakelama flava]
MASPAANFIDGIVRPMLRCFGIVAICFAVALLIGMCTGNDRFVAWTLIAAIPPMIWIENRRKKARSREQRARNALFGLGKS